MTAIRPEELEFPNTMTDIDYDTWMLRCVTLGTLYRTGRAAILLEFIIYLCDDIIFLNIIFQYLVTTNIN